MRNKLDKLAVSLSFSVSCASQSSVGVARHQVTNFTKDTYPESDHQSKMRDASRLLPLSKPNISAGLQRLIKSLKGLSHLFSLLKQEDDDEEIGMVIGFPTDVQHVTHIGLDGDKVSNNVSVMSKNLDSAAELFSLHSLTLNQFELAMAKRTDSSLARGSFKII